MGAWWPFGRKSAPERPFEDLPYEQLFEQFASEPSAAMEEFDHRLFRTVFAMALETAQNEGLAGEELIRRAEALTEQAFAAFEAEFDKGAHAYGLARFADTLRGVLGEEVFGRNAATFYMQLPLYYLEDSELRSSLAMVLERGMSDQAFTDVAGIKGITVEELQDRVAAAVRAVNTVKTSEFAAGEIAKLTEGYLR